MDDYAHDSASFAWNARSFGSLDECAVDIERRRDDESALLEELFPEWLHAKHSRDDADKAHDFHRGTR